MRVLLVFAFLRNWYNNGLFPDCSTTPFIQLWLKIFRSSALQQAPRCFSISPVIPSVPGAFLVFTFSKASFSSFMLKGSVMEQSRSSPYNDRMMFSVSSLTCLMILISGSITTVIIFIKTAMEHRHEVWSHYSSTDRKHGERLKQHSISSRLSSTAVCAKSSVSSGKRR